MRTLLRVLALVSVLALGVLAYRENYATQATLREVRGLQQEIADLREALSIQRAEWAYLNRPDRLRELSTINFDRLRLLPLEPEQFGLSSQIAFPAPKVELPEVNGPVDVSGIEGLEKVELP